MTRGRRRVPKVTLIWAMQSAIVERLFKPAEIAHNQKMSRIAGVNAKLHIAGSGRLSHTSFRYMASNHGILNASAGVIIPKLNESLYSEVDSLLRIKKRIDDVERPYVNDYVVLAMQQGVTMAGIKKLLPEIVHDIVDTYQGSFPTETVTPSDETLMAFTQLNDKYLMVLKQRLATNLIVI